MEREQEIRKLVNVLRQEARSAQQALWTGTADAGATAHAAEQYNRVLARLSLIDAGLAGLFEPLATDSSLTVVAMACRRLAAYYADEVGGSGDERGWSGWPGAAGAAFDPDGFKRFWRKSADEIESLGEYMRENMGPWLTHRLRHAERMHRRHGPGCRPGDSPPVRPEDGPHARPEQGPMGED